MLNSATLTGELSSYMRTQIKPFLPEDIIINILSRLPAKSIGRCRCMSKSWRSLLSQPHFIKIHIDRIRNTPSLLLIERCSTWYYATLDNAHQVFDEMSLRPTKLDFAVNFYCWCGSIVSCDGLVLIESEGKLILLNPITNQVKQIPFYLDTSGSTIYGLGYDSVNHDYKIVTLTHYFDKRDSLVKVCSVKNGAWKNLENRPYDSTFGDAFSGVYINGYIHWLVFNESQNNSKILSLDLAEEKFCESLLPVCVTKDIKYGDIIDVVLLRGCLSVFCYNGENCVWTMNDYGSNQSWTKFTIIDPEGEPCKPICMLDQEQVLVERGSRFSNKLVKYNLKNGTYKDIVLEGIDSGSIDVGGTFVEGLVSPYCSNDTS